MALHPPDVSPHADDEHGSRHISTVVFIIAMEVEALPILERFKLTQDNTIFPEGVPWIRHHGSYKDLYLNVILPGKDLVLGVDNIGTVPAALVSYASIQALKPDLIINAGTAGGYMLVKYTAVPSANKEVLKFQSKGAPNAEVFLVSRVAFHHRRNPLPRHDLYSVGLRHSFSTPALSAALQLKEGILSTGDSFDICPPDDAFIEANNANLVDMEGAAVAYVADLLNVPAVFLKVVSNAVDDGKPSVDEFHQNLAVATSSLDQTVARVIDFLSGKCLSEL